jgi:hypothetical protein
MSRHAAPRGKPAAGGIDKRSACVTLGVRVALRIAYDEEMSERIWQYLSGIELCMNYLRQFEA